jgi:hypothetical protein
MRTRTEDCRRPHRSWQLLGLILAAAMVLPACNGGLTISPTAASALPSDPTPPSTTPSPPATDNRVTLFIRGDLDDGGSFEGYITYGSRDQDSRDGFGRFQGGLWELVVHGGTRTHDVRFANGTGGRALIETYASPFPAIGLIFLWPDVDPAIQGFSPHVAPIAGYNPEQQPLLRDLGPLIPGVPGQFGVFADGEGGVALVTSIDIR